MLRSHIVRWLSLAGLVTAGLLSLPPRVGAQVVYPYPPAYRYLNAEASVRIEVTPKQAEVYVDGYYAGVVDDFDGAFQRLHVPAGQHEIVIYLDGYRALHQTVYLMPDKTFHIKERLEKLGPGEIAEARPVPAPMTAQTPAPTFPPGTFPPGRGRRGAQPPSVPPAPIPPPQGEGQAGAPTSSSGTGTLSIDLQPSDADVLIDGQPVASSGQGPLVMDLPAGRHVVQVRKSGFVGYLTEVQIRAGATSTLTINLRPQPR
jgi:hypothetical protein